MMADEARVQKRKALFMESKVEMFSAVDKGDKRIDIANKFGIPPSSLSTIIKNKQSIILRKIKIFKSQL